jgi:hypothetical protein
MQREGSESALADYARRIFSCVAIFLLSALALSTGARAPYLHRVSPAAHTSKASTLAEIGQEVAPQVQPAKASAYPGELPRTNSSFPIRETAFRKPPGILRVHALRSPPII